MIPILKWARQPTTIAGLSALSGAALALLGGQMTWQGAAPIIVAALVGIILPDNSVAKEEVAKVVADAIKAEGAITGKQP